MITKPDIPGTVIRWVGTTAPRILPSAAETVAIPLVHDWGPVGGDPAGVDGKQGGAQELLSFSEWTGLYGDSDTPGRTAVAGAFAGQGLPGAPGAGAVMAYRMAGASAAKGTITINSTGTGTPPAVRLDAKFVGSRANRFAYTIDVDPSNAARDRLRILVDGSVQETYVYTNTDLATLVSIINLRSNLVTATDLLGTPGRLTASSSPVALAGGDDGATVTGADHVAALTALELQPFGIIAPYDLTDASILASYASWTQTQEDANRPVRLVIGGAAGEDITASLLRTTSLENPHILNFGVGTWHDDLLAKDLSTSQLAPRIAGILAAAGETQSLTYRKIGGLHAVGSTGPATDAVESAVTGGVIVLMQASAPDADVRIAKGVTTFTSSSDAARPLDVFSDARLVGVMDNYVRGMKQWGDDVVIGALPVNQDTRDLVRGQARKMEDDLLRRGLILPGDDIQIPKPFVVVDDPGDPALADAIPYSFGWQFAFTANAILGEGQIR